MRITLFLTAAFALAGCTAQAPDCGSLAVTGAWLRAAPAGADIAAGYLTADNPGPERVVITGASSPDFARAQMHRSVETDGRMRMEPMDEVAVEPGESVAFAPGGRHLMLFEPAIELESGGRAQMRLACGDGEVAFTAEVRSRAPEAGGHRH